MRDVWFFFGSWSLVVKMLRSSGFRSWSENRVELLGFLCLSEFGCQDLRSSDLQPRWLKTELRCWNCFVLSLALFVCQKPTLL